MTTNEGQYLAVFFNTANAMPCDPIKVNSLTQGKQLKKELKNAGYVVSGIFSVDIKNRSARKIAV